MITNHNYQRHQNTSFQGLDLSKISKKVFNPINDNIVEPIFSKYIDVFARNEKIQKLAENANMKKIQAIVPPAISFWMSTWYIAFTMRNPKIEQERKKTLAVNMAFVALFCTAVQGTFNKNSGKLKQIILNSSISKNIKNKTQQSLVRFFQILNDKENAKTGAFLKALAKNPDAVTTFKQAVDEFVVNRANSFGRYRRVKNQEALSKVEILSEEEMSNLRNAVDVVTNELKHNPEITTDAIESKIDKTQISTIMKKLSAQGGFGSVITKLDHGKYPILTDHLVNNKLLKGLGCISEDGKVLKNEEETKAIIASLSKEKIEQLKKELNLNNEIVRKLKVSSNNISQEDLIKEMNQDINKHLLFVHPLSKTLETKINELVKKLAGDDKGLKEILNQQTLIEQIKTLSNLDVKKEGAALFKEATEEQAIILARSDVKKEAKNLLAKDMKRLETPIHMSSDDIDEMNKMQEDKLSRTKMIQFFNLSNNKKLVESGQKQDLNKFAEVVETIFSIDYFIPIVSNIFVFRILGPVLATPTAAAVTNFFLDKKKAKQLAATSLTSGQPAQPRLNKKA